MICTAWKVSKYGVISGSYFFLFGLNAEFYWCKILKIWCTVFCVWCKIVLIFSFWIWCQKFQVLCNFLFFFNLKYFFFDLVKNISYKNFLVLRNNFNCLVQWFSILRFCVFFSKCLVYFISYIVNCVRLYSLLNKSFSSLL